MRRLGQAVADALTELGELEDPEHCRVEVESADGALIAVWLKGGTMRDKTVFAALVWKNSGGSLIIPDIC